MNDQDRQAFEQVHCDMEGFYPVRDDSKYPGYPDKRAAQLWEYFASGIAHRDAQHAELLREVRELVSQVIEAKMCEDAHSSQEAYDCLLDAYKIAARLREKVGEV